VTWALAICESTKLRLAHVVAGVGVPLLRDGALLVRWSPYYFVQYLVDAKRITVW